MISSPSTDRIEKHIDLKAPQARVWQAISDAPEFGRWFGANLEGQAFAPGRVARGAITYPGYEHLTMEVQVVDVDPPRRLAFHWHPYAVEPGVDYRDEPPTLVEFTLVATPGGTRLTVVESGFDRLPAHRRDLAFRMNEGGWAAQMDNVARHVDQPA